MSELDQDMKPKPNKCMVVFSCTSQKDSCALFAEDNVTGYCKYMSSTGRCCSKVAQAQKMRAALEEMGIDDE